MHRKQTLWFALAVDLTSTYIGMHLYRQGIIMYISDTTINAQEILRSQDSPLLLGTSDQFNTRYLVVLQFLQPFQDPLQAARKKFDPGWLVHPCQ